MIDTTKIKQGLEKYSITTKKEIKTFCLKQRKVSLPKLTILISKQFNLILKEGNLFATAYNIYLL